MKMPLIILPLANACFCLFIASTAPQLPPYAKMRSVAGDIANKVHAALLEMAAEVQN